MRQEFKSPMTPMGNIGLLLQWVHYFASAIDPVSHMLYSSLPAPISYFDIPHQHFKSSLLHLAYSAVHLS
eukprot:1963494-Karenia_brevis.AAC.1